MCVCVSVCVYENETEDEIHNVQYEHWDLNKEFSAVVGNPFVYICFS